jgi:hypothetical protein
MIRRFLLALGLSGMLLLAAPAAAGASQDVLSGVDCGQAHDSAVCTDKTSSDPVTGSSGVLAKVTNFIAFIAGATAVIVILVSALRFVLSGSDVSTGSRTDTDVENARHTLANALIGLAIIALSRQIILFMLSKT